MIHTPKTRDQCPQCWQFKNWPADFIGKRGKPVKRCRDCQAHYGNWGNLTAAQRKAIPHAGVPALEPLRARLAPRSGNPKLGGIPASMTSRGTCPPSCAFYENGCYAEYHVVAYHWRRVGKRGDDWAAFCADVAALPAGQLWRHNVAGDLPGHGENIDGDALIQLVEANRGRRGFTFTHKHDASNWQAINWAVSHGFVINLSADTLSHADELADLGIAPVVVVLPSDTPDRGTRTPEGRKVIVCPAQKSDDAISCATCRLCAVAGRRAIVGFRAHGPGKYLVDPAVSKRRLPLAEATA